MRKKSLWQNERVKNYGDYFFRTFQLPLSFFALNPSQIRSSKKREEKKKDFDGLDPLRTQKAPASDSIITHKKVCALNSTAVNVRAR